MFIAVSLFIVACSGGGQDYRYGRTSKDTQTVSNSSLTYRAWRPSQKHTIPVVMNPRVERWVKTFNGSLRKNFERWVKRLGHYGPMIEKVLKEEGAPPDLIYLSMIESGFNMHASSTASAVGPWQFIQSTGKMYGLDKEFFVDERKDILQATRAAARHLKDLYKIYGDWYLAFSAYNAGPGKTNSAIRRGGTKNYWTLTSPRSRLFWQETKDYVPKILAALHIVKNYKKYGYTDKSFGAPLTYDRVSVPDATDVHTIAKTTSSTPEHIAALNPNLNLGITPPGQKFPILIPKGAREEFLRKYSTVPASKRVSHLVYQTGYGETITSIARKYHLNPSSITRINKHHSATTQLKPNTKIKIPANKSTLLALSKGGYGQSYAGGGKSNVAYYKIRRGDTLHRIAQRNRTTIANLSRWNGLGRHSRLTAGRTLKIYRSGGGTQRYGSGHLIAMANPFLSNPSGEIRMSGVRHIIHNDEQSLDEFIAPTVIAKTKVEDLPVPQLVASEDTSTNHDETKTAPALIKTVTGETIGEDLENPEANSDIDSALAQLQSDQATKTSVQSKALYHVVKRGETLSGISAKYRVRLSQLRQLNRLRSDTVRISQKLLIKNSAPQTTVIAQSSAPQTSTKPVQGTSVYRVQAGDTLSSIAKANRIPLNRLVALNNIQGSKIKIGQKLFLKSSTPDASPSPVVAVSQPTQVASSHGNSVYVVKPNDSISTIATRHRVRVSEIMAWNNLKSSNIQAGQKIKILRGSLTTSTGSTSGKGKVIVHKVRTGDTLWSLSRKYGVKISDIIRWNNLKGNQVRPNQQIKIIAGLQTKSNPLI